MPAVTINPDDGAGNNIVNHTVAQSEITLSGSVGGLAPGANFTLTVTDGSFNKSYTATVNAAGNGWTATISNTDLMGLADGILTVTAQVTNQFGSALATQTFTVAETLPTVTINAIEASTGNVINHTNAAAGIALSGSVTGLVAGATFSVTLTDGSFSKTYTATVDGTGTSWTATIPAGDALQLPNGTAAVTAQIPDQFGNTATATQTLTVAEAGPSITITTPIAGDNVVNASEAAAGFAIGGSETGADGQPVTVTITDSQGHVVDSYTTTAASGGSWSVSVTPAQAQGLRDGTYTVAASVSDASHNTATATQTLTVAEAGPSITITTPIAGDNVVNASEAAAGFAIGGSETGADSQPVTVTITDSQGHVVDSYTTTAASGGKLVGVQVTPAQAQGLKDGTYTVAASVSDASHNTATATQTLTVAEAGPSITITTPIAGDNVVNASEAAAGFAIGGSETGADGQLITVTISQGDVVVESFTTMAGSGGSWSVSVPAGQELADGTYTVAASVADANHNTATATQTLTVAEAGPSITITTPIAGDNVVNASEARPGLLSVAARPAQTGRPSRSRSARPGRSSTATRRRRRRQLVGDGDGDASAGARRQLHGDGERVGWPATRRRRRRR